MPEVSKEKLKNNIERILGAIVLDNDLNPPTNLINPCSICNKNCLSNQKWIQCDNCEKRCHIKCDGTTAVEYKFYEDEKNAHIYWHCLYCSVKFNHSNIPFTASCVSELININQSDSLEFLNFLPSLEIVNETASYEKYSLPDANFDLPNLVNSKYHTVEDFQKLDIQDNFNIFHANVNGLESKFETLRTFLECSKSSMNVIAITETSENENDSFLTNVSMNCFKPPFHTPTSTP